VTHSAAGRLCGTPRTGQTARSTRSTRSRRRRSLLSPTATVISRNVVAGTESQARRMPPDRGRLHPK